MIGSNPYLISKSPRNQVSPTTWRPLQTRSAQATGRFRGAAAHPDAGHGVCAGAEHGAAGGGRRIAGEFAARAPVVSRLGKFIGMTGGKWMGL